MPFDKDFHVSLKSLEPGQESPWTQEQLDAMRKAVADQAAQERARPTPPDSNSSLTSRGEKPGN